MTKPTLDIDANRRGQNWSKTELAGRALWELFGAPLFLVSPRILWGARTTILRLFGARVGRKVHIHPTVRIAIPWNLTISDNVGIGDRVQLYSLGLITIADCATISQNAHLCAGSHDHLNPKLPLTKPPISIQAGAWVCADSFIGPGVTIGELAVVGARAVVLRDVPANAVVAGNPACQISVRKIRENSD